jgi:hypothetical protein
MNTQREEVTATAAPAPEAYEPPRVEAVVDAESLRREVHYAGGNSLPG